MDQMRSFCTNPKIEIRTDDKGVKMLTGYAALYDSPSDAGGNYTEVIAKGAFDQAMKDPDLLVLCRIEHNSGLNVIGSTKGGNLMLACDSLGLRYSCIPSDTQAGRDILTLVKEGHISQSSFAFTLADDGDEWDMDNEPMPLRTITNVGKLYDVAPCAFGFYDKTSVSAKALVEKAKGKIVVPMPKNWREDVYRRKAQIDELRTKNKL